MFDIMPISPKRAFTICIVDEDDSVRSGLATLLRPLQAVIRTYGSAEELLDSLGDAQPDCLITELTLPGLEGRQLHRELAKRGYEVPVIFLARNGDVRQAVEAMRAGAIDFIEKPFIDKSLFERVQSIIEARLGQS